MKYLITLSYQDKRGLPYSRTVIRDDDDSAIDSAKRLLRLSRNAGPRNGRKFDKWIVHRRFGEQSIILIATGAAE